MEQILQHKIKNPMLGLINDFEKLIDSFKTFSESMIKRKEELEDLKDELLIYNDKEFMTSIKRADEDITAGRMKRFSSKAEFDKYFDNLLK